MRVHTATIPAEALRIQPREAYYARQKRLFALAFILVSLVPLALLNYEASRFYQASWMEKTTLELAGMAASRRELIDLFLRTQEAQLASLVETHTQAELTREPRLQDLFRAVSRNGVITDLGVIDREGRHLAYAGPFQRELAGRNYAGAEWFAEVMRTGRYVSDVFPGYRNVPHIIVAVTDARKDWILRATIDSGLFNGLVASANVGPGGDAYIIDLQGRLQTPSRHGHQRIPPEEVRPIARLADGGRMSDAIGGSLFAAARLNGGTWLLVLETNVDSSLAAYHRARQRNGLIILAAAVAIVLVAVLLTRSMVDRLARADGQRAALSERVRHVEKMALVGRLAASVAHEINNPLQNISEHAGLVDEILRGGAPAGGADLEECHRSLQKIRDQVTRASAITHRLLGFSRAPDRPREPADLNRAVEDTIALLEGEARRHRIAIARDFQSDLAPVGTDPGQLQQVVLNVLGNAMDAIGSGGEIRVATRADGPWLRIDVLDSGPGLPAEALARMFDPFFTTKRNGKGTGLGLFVSRNIMERLGGDLTASNRAGGGSVFTIRLPAPGPHHAPPPLDAQPGRP
ncbi:MAG TPA: ATP-binding protein [Anaeromyxobacteraceae bacterium]|nr:ATP-binding protein [Anaeromyxobacteraceae bacterium]